MGNLNHEPEKLKINKAVRCKNCSFRRMHAIVYDQHFDWRDCPYKKCEVKEAEDAEED